MKGGDRNLEAAQKGSSLLLVLDHSITVRVTRRNVELAIPTELNDDDDELNIVIVG